MEFTNLKSIINVLNENKELIVSEWIRKGAAYERLKQNNISPKFFAKHFGVRVTDYALGIITGESKLGNCPVIHVLLQFFKDKDISLSDIFIICAGLKNTLIQIMLAESLLTKDRLNEVAYLMDRNFEGVMKEYLGIDNEQIINKKDSEEQFSSKTETKPKAPIISAYEYINDFSIEIGRAHV